LILVGENKSSTILDANKTEGFCAISVGANDVYITGFTIKNADSNGIDVWPYRGNITINGNIIVNNGGHGICLRDVDQSIITGNIITDNGGSGIYLETSSRIMIKENFIANNSCVEPLDGIRLVKASGNCIIGNIVTNNLNGIGLQHSSNNILTGNTIQNNHQYGINLWWSPDNNISRNFITKNGKWFYGILVYDSTENSISENTVQNNWGGIQLGRSSSNVIFHNNFVNNTKQVDLYDGSGYNTWNNSYPSGGNYWSNYNGTDLHNGAYQNETGSDGIGDSPYVVDENNIDHYPLMGPFNSFNTSVGYSVDVISNSTVEDFRYFESNSTIIMHVSNMTANQTAGFCRITIPHELIAPPYNITVNNNSTDYSAIFENETLSIIYFTYEHSRLEIIIIPEFPSTRILTLFTLTTLIATILLKKKRRSKHRPLS